MHDPFVWHTGYDLSAQRNGHNGAIRSHFINLHKANPFPVGCRQYGIQIPGIAVDTRLR
ncbi:hypothetical protein GCM10027185_21000 [Spirosoma pulveris]